MKKIFAILAVSLSIFLIYFFNKYTSVYYVALGDKNNNYYEDLTEYLESYEKLEVAKLQFLSNNSNIDDVYNQIKRNVTVENQTIKNALIKADLVTIYLNYDDVLNNEGDFSKVDEKIDKLNKLLKIIRSYCKEKIVLIGPDDKFSGSLKYLNKMYRDIANDYHIEYIKTNNSEDLTSDIISKVKLKAWFYIKYLLQ